MKYHDNEVVIDLYNFYDLTLVGGSYTVNEFSVTSGQDPDGNIHTGLVKNFGGDGKMSFRVGRKGSETTANWFNNRIQSSQTTFNHTAGKLNFAFIGTLVLTFTSGSYGSNRVTFTFNDVAIAQGHAGASNNWWFGGKNCAYHASNTVLCAGTNSNGVNAKIDVVRGGNSVNYITLYPSSGFSYHDNEVSIDVNGHGYSLVNGKFTVTSFDVSDGQDPLGNAYSGLVQNLGSDGTMTFRLGRHGTDETANWFNTRIPAENTTFNHTAGKLNFAFIGTLELTLTGGILGTGQEKFIFQDIAIAQGHAGASNNWWFGGTHCSHLDGKRVSGRGETNSQAEISFKFHRGGNNVHTVDVDASNFIDTANWMSQISNTTTLNQLVMPGSHDAGMSELHHCFPPVGADGYTQTQGGSIKQQLLDGSRYFDIRVDYDYDELVTYHRDEKLGVGLGCSGQSLKAVLDEATNFLNAHNTEIAILKFSHIRNTEGHDPAIIKQKIDQLLNSYAANIYVNSASNVNLTNLQLNNVRGKMILVFDYSDYISPSTGRFRYKDGSSAISGVNLVVYDEYSRTADYNTMSTDQVTKWDAHGRLGQDFMFLLSWTLTAPPIGSWVKTLAEEANSKLPEVMNQQINVNRKGKPNIVYIDYLNAESASVAILYNL